MTVVNGFLGMRHYKDGLMFNPSIPKAWKRYNCKIRYRGALMDITVDEDQATFVLISGSQIVFRVHDHEVCLTESESTYICKSSVI